jgi:hypothetical protein
MTKSICMVASAMLATAAAVGSAHAQESGPYPIVYVKGADHGQGMTRQYRNECYVITPHHVVFGKEGDGGSAPEVTIVTSGGRPIEVGSIFPFPPVTVLQVNRDPDSQVCAPPVPMRRIERALRKLTPGGQRGTVSQRLSNGVLTSLPVRIYPEGEDGSRLRIDPDSGRTFWPGTSGGLVYVQIDSTDAVPVGMVMETPRLGPDSTAPLGAEVYTLTYVEGLVRNYFRYVHRPGSMDLLGSVLLPGMGQNATQRRTIAIVWVGMTAAAVVAVGQIQRTVTETRTFIDGVGIPRNYPYQVREYPYRGLGPAAAVWIVGGALSAAEATWYVHSKYPRRDGSQTPGAQNLSVRIAPQRTRGDGAPDIALSVQLSF